MASNQLPVGANVREVAQGGRTNIVQYRGVVLDHETRYAGTRQARRLVLVVFEIDGRTVRQWVDPARLTLV